MKQVFGFIFSVALCCSSLLYGETSSFDARRIFLKREVLGGRVPPSSYGYLNELRVYKNGRVTHFTKANRDANPKETEIGQLNIFVLQKIQADLKKFEITELKTDESQPECMDAPNTYYSSPLWEKNFAAVKNCRTYLPEGEAYVFARDLQMVLDGLALLTTQ